MDKIVPAGKFKQGCLAILDEVARTHRHVIVSVLPARVRELT